MKIKEEKVLKSMIGIIKSSYFSFLLKIRIVSNAYKLAGKNEHRLTSADYFAMEDVPHDGSHR